MSSTAIRIREETAARLIARAEHEGVDADLLAEKALSQFLDHDPYEFIGSVSSDDIVGERADALLESLDFGT